MKSQTYNFFVWARIVVCAALFTLPLGSAFAQIPPPTLVSPGTGSEPGQSITTSTPTFQWQSVSGADQYGLYISKKNSSGTYDLIFDSEVRGVKIIGTTYSLPSGILVNGGQYRWNMRSHNNAGWGTTYSNRLYFTVNLVTLKPDLIVQTLTVNPTSVNPGGNITVSFTVKNQGNGAASSSQTNIRLNTSSGNVTPSDLLLKSVTTPAVAAGASTTHNETVPIPTTTSAGSYFVWVILDVNSSVGQSNENNDRENTSLTVVANKPDLVVQTLTVNPALVNPGGNVTVSFTVKNQGNGAASSSQTNIRLNTSSSNVTPSDPLLKSVTTPAVAAGASTVHSETMTIPSGTSAGNYYVWVILDVNNSIGQSNENNDKANAPLTIPPPTLPDLTVSATVASSYTSGQGGVQIPVKVTRTGGNLTLGTYVDTHLFWSTNSTLDGGDTQLWRSNNSTPDFPNSYLNTNGSKTVTAAINIPSVPNGSYYIIAVVDLSNFHAESNDNNNVSAYPVSIIPPEVTVAWVTPPPSTLTSGQTFSVSWKITGGTSVSHTNIHWDTIDPTNPDRCNPNNNPPCSNNAQNGSPGTYNDIKMVAPTVSSSTVYKYIVHAKVDGVDYWSQIAPITVIPPTTGPIRLRAPWDERQYWVPQTYDTHWCRLDGTCPDFPKGWESARRAVDFYYASDQSKGGTSRVGVDEPNFTDEQKGKGKRVLAAHAGTAKLVWISQCGAYKLQITGVDLNGVPVTTEYIHLSISPQVTDGQRVWAGDPVGSVSDLGCATPGYYHLMFIAYRNGEAVALDDPNGVLLDGEMIFSGTPQSWNGGLDLGNVYRYSAMPRGTSGEEITDDFLNTVFEEAARTYGIPSNLLRAIAYEESKWEQAALSSDGGIGIMQLTDEAIWSEAERLTGKNRELMKQVTREGARANIMGAAAVLGDMFDNPVPPKWIKSGTPLVSPGDPRNALETWWWILARYNGAGADGRLETTNYPFRVFNWILNGVPDKVPKIAISFPLGVTSREATPEEKATSEVRDSDANLFPPAPRGYIRITPDFKALDLVLHGNDGSIIHTPGLSLTPSNRGVPATAGSTTFDVANTGSGTMNYTASVTDGSSWLSITSGGSGGNSGTVTVSYTANPGPQQRVGRITVTAIGAKESPKSVTITQAPIIDVWVWPGDTNNDGRVDQKDILPIGFYWNKKGPARPPPSSEWKAWPAQPWEPLPATYADANGDGVVDQRDVIPIGLNWGKTSAAPLAMRDVVSAAAPQGGLPKEALLAHEPYYREMLATLGDDFSPVRDALMELLALAREYAIPDRSALLPNYPNPFNPETWIPYQLAEPALVMLRIFDIHGHLVRTLEVGYQEAGVYTTRQRAAYWDGRNNAGERVASGMYLYQLRIGNQTFTRRMIVLK